MGRRRARRGFGSIRRLPSGRYQAAYAGQDLKRHTAPWTFDARGDAEVWLGGEQRLMASDQWSSPAAREAARRHAAAANRANTFDGYARAWLRQKSHEVKSQTLASYRTSVERHLVPTFGEIPMIEITDDRVRAWFYGYGDETPTARAHAYQTLRSIMLAALDAGVVPRNPCRIKGGQRTKPKREGEMLSLKELWALYDAMPENHRALVLLSGLGGLRIGEALALRSRDVDLQSGTVTVAGTTIPGKGEAVRSSTAKTPGSHRTVALPSQAVRALEDHLALHPPSRRDDLVFMNSKGGPLRHQTIYGRRASVSKWGVRSRGAYGWYAAIEVIDRPTLRFHDLRGTAATLAARLGATPKETMARLGHTTLATAMRYQVADAARDRQTADALSKSMAEARPPEPLH